jgi:RNA polymerase sigma factor (sigma-70 family)
MSDSNPFHDLIRRVRAGDQQAATELVRRYEPAICRAVRVRLVDTRLQRLFDSMDICQSVLGSFFVRAALGEYELDQPEQLLKLLVRMARNKLADAAKKQGAACRDRRRDTTDSVDTKNCACPSGSPSQEVAGRELLERFRERLSADERQLADKRASGRAWGDIAAEHGSTTEALRKQLARAVDRVAHQLGLEEVHHG